MKKLAQLLVVAIIAIAAAQPAQAQFKFGVKAGVTMNDFHFSKSDFNADNCAGFTGGIMVQGMIPITNIGFDASLMYVHRSSNLFLPSDKNNTVEKSNVKSDYLTIPVNLKWMIGIPAVGHFISPYIFTGPSFSFLVSKKDVTEFLKNKSCDVSWNIGVGVQLMSKLQVGASYGFGLTKMLTGNNDKIEGKNRNWTITAAYLF